VNKKIFIITGPSAVGKTTIAKHVIKLGLPLKKVVTTTTRQRRKGERDGYNYHFITRKKFEQLIKDRQMFEWTKYADHYYGSQKRHVEQIIKSGKHPLWITEVEGAEYFKKRYKKLSVVIFIVPHSFSVLRDRLEKRGAPEADIRTRLKISREELKQSSKFDYRVINYNGKLENVVNEVAEIVKREIN